MSPEAAKMSLPLLPSQQTLWVLYWGAEHMDDYSNSSSYPKYFLCDNKLKIAFHFQVAYMLLTESLHQVKDDQTNGSKTRDIKSNPNVPTAIVFL